MGSSEVAIAGVSTVGVATLGVSSSGTGNFGGEPVPELLPESANGGAGASSMSSFFVPSASDAVNDSGAVKGAGYVAGADSSSTAVY